MELVFDNTSYNLLFLDLDSLVSTEVENFVKLNLRLELYNILIANKNRIMLETIRNLKPTEIVMCSGRYKRL